MDGVSGTFRIRIFLDGIERSFYDKTFKRSSYKIFLDGIESNGDPGNELGIVRLGRCYRFPSR